MNKELDKYSIEELEAAISNKKLKKELKIELFDINRYQDFIKEINSTMEDDLNGEGDSDTEHWIYEATLKFVYGDNVFDILNGLKK